MNKPILISAGVICAIILVSGFLNQSQNDPSSKQPTNLAQIDPKQQEILNTLDNLAKIEGQKITAIKGPIVDLENGEKVDFGSNPIKCQVGDIIENYTVANQSLVCIRKDEKGNVLSSIIMPIGLGITSGLIANYIASKVFAQNNGLNRMPNSYDYRGNNGQVYNSYFEGQTQNSSGQNRNNSNRRSFGTGRAGGLGGIFGGLGNNNSGSNDAGSNANSGSKNTGGLSTGSKGGISIGSKGGGGG
jgi:hypothetical protein